MTKNIMKIHKQLGLSLTHKSAVLILPLVSVQNVLKIKFFLKENFFKTPKKEYDITILSEKFDESIIQLIYATIKSAI